MSGFTKKKIKCTWYFLSKYSRLSVSDNKMDYIMDVVVVCYESMLMILRFFRIFFGDFFEDCFVCFNFRTRFLYHAKRINYEFNSLIFIILGYYVISFKSWREIVNYIIQRIFWIEYLHLPLLNKQVWLDFFLEIVNLKSKKIKWLSVNQFEFQFFY